MRQGGETGPRGCLVQLTLSTGWLRWGNSRLLQPGVGVSISNAGGPPLCCEKFFLVSSGIFSCCHLSLLQLLQEERGSLCRQQQGFPSSSPSPTTVGGPSHVPALPVPCRTWVPLGHAVLPGAGRDCPEHHGQRSEARQCRNGAETSIYSRRPCQGQARSSSIALCPTSDCLQPASRCQTGSSFGLALLSWDTPVLPTLTRLGFSPAWGHPGLFLGSPLQLRDCYTTHHPGRLSRTAPAHETARPLSQPSSKNGVHQQGVCFQPSSLAPLAHPPLHSSRPTCTERQQAANFCWMCLYLSSSCSDTDGCSLAAACRKSSMVRMRAELSVSSPA